MPEPRAFENWKIIYESDMGPWKFGFRFICEQMREAGRLLYEAGMMPEVARKPESTHSNMASRINCQTDEFIVTAAGSHKGRLTENDFVWVREINWDENCIKVRADLPDKKPSTGVWLADAIFKKFPTYFTSEDFTRNGFPKSEAEKRPQVGAIIHTHSFPKVKAKVAISHPPLDPKEWEPLFKFIGEGKKMIILTNHGSLALGATIPVALARILPEIDTV